MNSQPPVRLAHENQRPTQVQTLVRAAYSFSPENGSGMEETRSKARYQSRESSPMKSDILIFNAPLAMYTELFRNAPNHSHSRISQRRPAPIRVRVSVCMEVHSLSAK